MPADDSRDSVRRWVPSPPILTLPICASSWPVRCHDRRKSGGPSGLAVPQSVPALPRSTLAAD